MTKIERCPRWPVLVCSLSGTRLPEKGSPSLKNRGEQFSPCCPYMINHLKLSGLADASQVWASEWIEMATRCGICTSFFLPDVAPDFLPALEVTVSCRHASG